MAIVWDHKKFWVCDECGLVLPQPICEYFDEAPEYCMRCGVWFDTIKDGADQEYIEHEH